MAEDDVNNLEIYHEEICDDPEKLIAEFTEGVLDFSRSKPKLEILEIDKEYIDSLAAEAQSALDEKLNEAQLLTPPVAKNSKPLPPAEFFGGAPINVSISPGGPPLNKPMANPTENDQLLAVIRDNKPTSTILKTIMEEIAEEAAYLKAWRNDNWDTGEDISDTTSKRIKMLKSLVETIVEQEKLNKDSSSGKIDFHGEAFKRVLKYFLETIQATFHKIQIPVQYEDIFFTELAKAFDNFEKNAEKLYYGKE